VSQPPVPKPLPTPSVEDYLERIADLIRAKGYARAVDIADSLAIQQPSVTKMLQRLHDQGYVVYEKYRGLILTAEGAKVAESVKFRHDTLMRLLNMLGLHGAQTLADVEGIEHHVSGETINRLAAFVAYLEANPAVLRNFEAAATGPGEHAPAGTADPARP
jgi:Mn-dependent DtxR family transcriptional regulator